MERGISHDWRDKTDREKVRWFRSLTLEQRLDMWTEFSNFALALLHWRTSEMFDRLKVVFESLNSHQVRYLVIGGVAAIMHGSTRNTFDLDLLIDPSVENARRLLDAFLSINLGTASLITPQELVKNEITIFKDVVNIDVQTKTPGLDFETGVGPP